MASWNHDGTQDPGPPPLMADALSGKDDAEAVRVRVVEPAMPDIEAVREAMTSVLDEDSELIVVRRPAGPAPKGELEIPIVTTGTAGANDPDAGDGGTGVGPEAATPPAGVPAVALPPTPAARRISLGPLRRFASARAAIPLQRGARRRRPVRRSWWSPGLGAVILLLSVMVVLGIVMLASFIDTISSMFE